MPELRATRRTVLERDGLRGGVITYKNTHTGGWRTVVSAYAEDNPGIWSPAHTREEAGAQHAAAVRMVKLMGFTETRV